MVVHASFFNCKHVKHLVLPNNLRHDGANVIPLFRMNIQNPYMNHTVMAKGMVGCVSGSYKDRNFTVNVVLLVPMNLPIFVCADIDVNAC
jgi:hypothetical protein